MRKTLLILVAVLILSVPVGSFAATINPTGESLVLTEQQKSDLEESYADMIELKKEFINKMVNNGLMTEAQSKVQLERLDAMLDYHNDNSNGMFNWMMRGYGMMGGSGIMGGSGMMSGNENGFGYGMMNGNDNEYGKNNMMNRSGYFKGMMGK
jgi:hypothetical protein